MNGPGAGGGGPAGRETYEGGMQSDEAAADFVSKALANLGIVGQTPSGKKMLEDIEATGKKITIKQTYADNGYARRASEVGSETPGVGTNTTIGWNPSFGDGPTGMPERDLAKMPSRVMFHEFGHGRHNALGQNQQDTPMGGGWDTVEEYNTIYGNSPSEADYMKDLGIPWRRDDHDGTWVPQ